MISSIFFTILLSISAFAVPVCPPFNPNVPPVLFPHEWSCTLYYRCEQNGPVLMECWPPGTHFSPVTNRCEWEAVANCRLPGVPPTTSTTTTTTTTPPTTTTSTTTTTTTSTTTTTTPTTTTSTTTTPTTTTTTTTLPTTTTTTTTLPTTTTSTTTTTTVPTTTTTTQPTTTTTSQPTTTTTSFVIPTAPTGTTSRTLTTTPTTTTTTLPTTTTTLPTTTTTTTTTSTTTTTQEPTTTTSTQTTSEAPEICPPIDDPKNPQFFPNENDCSKYFLCFNGSIVERSCADGLFWDQNNLWCNFKNETECFWNNYDPRCPIPDDIYNPTHLPHETECNLFYKCSHGRRVLMECPENLHWSVEYDRCEYPSIAGCDINFLPPLPTWTPPISTTTEGFENQCPEIDDPDDLVFLPSNESCEIYYLCFNGDKIQRKCNEGLHWNVELNWCDFPENSGCELN
ncbi:hypothetical protein PVAND_016940 [Polypedilum vanderplanki]|uniref:Uncharacterized protein n=1 Tax=Polypedilum vanderplanki TaxID=319348 RepID=A0A9J6BHW1_POLVA|nr:hypothetical protein PVAND_016940 [Polypedilum vanderplanki]